MSGKILVIIIIIILISAGVAYCGFYYYEKGSAQPIEESAVKFELPQLDAGETAAQGTVNALENMPSVNPMEDVANPFEDTYVNPFE